MLGFSSISAFDVSLLVKGSNSSSSALKSVVQERKKESSQLRNLHPKLIENKTNRWNQNKNRRKKILLLTERVVRI